MLSSIDARPHSLDVFGGDPHPTVFTQFGIFTDPNHVSAVGIYDIQPDSTIGNTSLNAHAGSERYYAKVQ